jgi:hypothetical protein
LETTPNDTSIQYYRALLAYRSGDYRRAVELALPLDVRRTDFPSLDLLIGAASLADGYPQIAVQRLRRYLITAPQNPAVRALLDLAEASTDKPAELVVPRDQLLGAFDFPAIQPSAR